MTTLYLVRHGETPDNARQVLQGQIQGELNEVGIGQAEQVRDQLAGEHFDAVVASDLHRAIQTAEIIAAPHGLAVATTPLLRERDWGDFTGRYIPDLENAVFPDNVEPLPALLERAGRFVDYVRTTYPDQRVLAVGHGIVNKAVQAVLLGKTMREVVRMTNGEVRVLEV
ncbi:MAG: histidine phosphatase family protein [Prevotella sp.]|nr:histidine phosphatase family protein [Prevotella sp.]